MSTPWLYADVPAAVEAGHVTLMEGTTFCIGDARGDLGSLQPSGLFVRDTRMLRRWQLTVSGRPLDPLTIQHLSPHAATFVLFRPPNGGAAPLLVTRHRLVGDGMREDIVVRNSCARSIQVDLALAVDTDFADLFEVKEGRASGPTDVRVTVERQLELSLLGAEADYGVTIESSATPTIESHQLTWRLDLGGHESWSTTLMAVPRLHGHRLEPHHGPDTARGQAPPDHRRRQFHERAPELVTADPDLSKAVGRSLDDLATLRIFHPAHPELPVVAAGAPWFMALFGRDSLLTSIMLLPVDHGLALGTLTTLGSYQGSRLQPSTEEQPGRILHEMRFGPAAALALGGGNAYYGTADATPLFVMAVGELLRWHPTLVTAAMIEHVDRALDWMLGLGDPDRDGFIEYSRSTSRGLVNQGWKDSWDGINFADGTLARAPIALAEVQAYAYAAYLARAALADHVGDDRTATAWRDRAAELKRAFNETFWLPDRGWYAVGLDRDKTPIDALTSNNGHCLWTGIADRDKAERVVAHLMSPAMWTGWGIRTLASTMGAYDPMSYHNGSVWPHDTAVCIAGLTRYGHREEALEVALGLLDAAGPFGHRLPELFAGFSRADLDVPVPYPAACSPQAWAAAAPVEVLRALLGLEPGPDGLRCDPVLPDRFLPLGLHGVECRERRYDLDVDESGARVQLSG